MIWEWVVEQPHAVETRGFYDHSKKLWKTHGKGMALSVYPRFPPVHDVCHESRRAFLESSDFVPDTTGLGVAWHPERDALKCHNIEDRWDSDLNYDWSWWDDIRYSSYYTSWPPGLLGRNDVQNLQFSLSQFHDIFPIGAANDGRHMYRDWSEMQGEILQRFPNAKTVELVAGEEFQSSSGEPRSFEVTMSFPCGPVNFIRAWDILMGLRDSEYQEFSLKIVGKMVCRIKKETFNGRDW
ncbi:hypothetical protein PG997_001451 [Apiospora hydei]|uniref:Uncharacterized protein n=1 Tax=Apiospora hydei TaxID=1337664 RepID=A0ABR1XDL6_9PEZI